MRSEYNYMRRFCTRLLAMCAFSLALSFAIMPTGGGTENARGYGPERASNVSWVVQADYAPAQAYERFALSNKRDRDAQLARYEVTMISMRAQAVFNTVEVQRTGGKHRGVAIVI